jgi:hypothetical protein
MNVQMNLQKKTAPGNLAYADGRRAAYRYTFHRIH